jgi:hypothetical protein
MWACVCNSGSYGFDCSYDVPFLTGLTLSSERDAYSGSVSILWMFIRDDCSSHANALNTFEGVSGIYCSNSGLMGSYSSSAECDANKDALNKFPDVDFATCAARYGHGLNGEYNNGYYLRTVGYFGTRTVAALNKLLVDNVFTCSSAGTVDAAGRCTCDGPETGLGRTCSELSNAKDCSSVGTVDVNGDCVCDDPLLGAGSCNCTAASECPYSNSKTCNSAGTVDVSGKCTCTDSAIGNGPTCSEFSDSISCNSAGTVDATGKCTCKSGRYGTDCRSDHPILFEIACNKYYDRYSLFVPITKAESEALTAAYDQCRDDGGSYNVCQEIYDVQQCMEVANALNSFEGVIGMHCKNGITNGLLIPRLTFASSTSECFVGADALNKLPGVETDCSNYGLLLGGPSDDAAKCKQSAAVLNRLLPKQQTCDNADHGTFTNNGSCLCTAGYTGTTCQFTDRANCNDAATVQSDGSCSAGCTTTGHTGDRCDECLSDTHDLVEDGTVFRVASCDIQTNICDAPVQVPFITCIKKGALKECDLGEFSDVSASDGECNKCPANTYADGTLTDGTTADNGLRIVCKECPLNSVTRVPLVVGASTLHQCVAKCPSGQWSLDGSCVECDVNTFADGLDEDNAADDEGYRISCKPCLEGEISEAGATSCSAKYQKVSNQLFCYGNGTDSLSKIGGANADEFVFALSRVGAWESCENATLLTPSLADATFIRPDALGCPSTSASKDECDVAYTKAAAAGISAAGFCDYETRVGEQYGYPSQLCREHNCKGADTGNCWHPDLRGTTLYPLGCILNTNDNTVMYYSDEDAKRYYNGFAYQPICERKVCPADSDGDYQKPVPLGEDDFKTDADRKKVPECQLSKRGIEAKNEAATNRNNKVFIPIALSLTVVCMMVAAAITQDNLKWQWIFFGVGMRTFDM